MRSSCRLVNAEFLIAGDFNRNGRIDLAAGTRGAAPTILFENRIIGDANGDGIFNSSDLVAVFVAGLYEDSVGNNARFDTGDWNNDGEFDTSDLVLAFQAGTYSNLATAGVGITRTSEMLLQTIGESILTMSYPIQRILRSLGADSRVLENFPCRCLP